MRRERDVTVVIAEFQVRMVGAHNALNATAAYSIHHLAALATAAVWATRSPSDPDYLVLARDVLTSEAFALHFLQDSFSAGHFVGLLSDGNGTLARWSIETTSVPEEATSAR